MPWFSHPPDNRRFPRFKADVPAIANLVRDREIVSLRTHCDSISENGVGARGRGLEPLHLGDLVTMELHIPLSMQPIWVDTIVRYLAVRHRRGRCGLEFLSVSQDQRDLIKRYCKQQPLKKHWRWI